MVSQALKGTASVIVWSDDLRYLVLVPDLKERAQIQGYVYTLPGGKCLEGEAHRDAAIRELYEEANIVAQHSELSELAPLKSTRDHVHSLWYMLRPAELKLSKGPSSSTGLPEWIPTARVLLENTYKRDPGVLLLANSHACGVRRALHELLEGSEVFARHISSLACQDKEWAEIAQDLGLT